MPGYAPVLDMIRSDLLLANVILISESLSLSLSLSFFPVVSYLLFVGQPSSGHSSIGLNVLRAAHP